ncbi:MAG: CapA family protein [Bacteroidales bacterium]|nr:CapA family protein [Bacteroidales bacterium]
MTLLLSFATNFTAKTQEVRFSKYWAPPKAIYIPDTIKICFAGDVMMHSRQMEYDYSNYFREVDHLFRGADYAVANMEFTLAGEPYTGYPQFSAPDIYAEHVADSGVDIFLCANNHILDKGSEGAERTLKQYRRLSESHGVRFTGAAGSQEEMDSTTPLFIEEDGIRIALINFTYGTNSGSTDHWPKINYLNQREFLRRMLQKAENEAAFTIALPHWGEEYQLLHSEKQESIARWLIENGADLIVGTHPHVVQDIGYIDDVPVVYSLGNAVSNMSAANTQIGLFLTVELIVESNGKVRLGQMEPTYTWCSRPGGFGTSYAVVAVEDQIGKGGEWIGEWEYEKMMTTYERVRKTHNNEH